jgi:hypothetical protein
MKVIHFSTWVRVECDCGAVATGVGELQVTDELARTHDCPWRLEPRNGEHMDLPWWLEGAARQFDEESEQCDCYVSWPVPELNGLWTCRRCKRRAESRTRHARKGN